MRASLFIVLVLGAGCLHSSDHLQVRVKDARAVDVVDGKGAAVDVDASRDDVRVGKTTMFDDERQFGAAQRTITQDLGREVPERLRLVDHRFTWQKKRYTASTKASNVERAEVVTQWYQWQGTLPSLAAIVVGSVVAVGAGVASGGVINDAVVADPVDGALVGQGVGLGVFALGGVALLTYGIVSYSLVSAGVTRAPLPVE